mmetsp:Transcript_16230/g.29443  ORF Transcript_16230/g.29443 Transcript_16230/m.29443 type:complete len:92 (-) Transcript_16230:1192-1467(-)
MGDIQTNFFLEGVDTEQSQNIEEVEVRRHDDGNPREDPQDTADLGEEELAVSRSLSPHVEPAIVSMIAERGLGAGRLSEESHGDAAPDPVP